MENGARIPLKNYAKISDYYDTKISAADVLNKAELQHFHADLAAYLKKYDLPGADGVYTGKTGGKNVAVKALKKFSKETGITVDELKSNPLSKDKLIEIFDKINFKPADRRSIEIINNDAIIEKLQAKIHDLESKPVTADMTKEINHKDAQIKTLSQTIRDKDQILSQLIRHKAELEARLSDVNKELFVKQEALDKAQSRITELEQEKSMNVARQKEAYGWGQNSVSAWGDRSHTGWRTLNVDDEKKW